MEHVTWVSQEILLELALKMERKEFGLQSIHLALVSDHFISIQFISFALSE